MKLLPHQVEALKAVEGKNRCAFYHDMGLGKTEEGASKAEELNAPVNLVICQKSKILDWKEWIREYHTYCGHFVYDLTDPDELKAFMDHSKHTENHPEDEPAWGVINYELTFRRPELKKLKNFTLILDESSLIQNTTAKRTQFIMAMDPANVILLSGTPTGGKYERLWTQMKLLGWNIGEEMFFNQFVDFYWDMSSGFPIRVITGYKNEERLKRKMRQYGCHFLKTEDVIDLPDQNFQTIMVPTSAAYKAFKKDRIVQIDGQELVGDTTLTRMLYERQLCGVWSDEKFEAFSDLLDSTNDRLVVFYNFNLELDRLMEITGNHNRPMGVVNGSVKNPEVLNTESAVLFVQYQAGAMGLNLQVANKIIYFSPPLSSELFEQSKKRIHRIGQNRPCFYYQLVCSGSVEAQIYRNLKMRQDYTEALFEEENGR